MVVVVEVIVVVMKWKREKALQGDGARKMMTKEETAQVQEREMPTKMSVCSREKERGKRETN